MKRFSSIVNPKSGAGAGIALMLLACLVFSLNDTLGKWLVATYTVGQLLLIRSAAAMLILLPFLLRREALAEFSAAPRPRLQILRVVLSSVESALFYWAVVYLPLADVVTFYLAGPIFVTAFSALLLKEQVGWRRWSAVLAGFAGVVIAMRPSAASFSWPALIALTGCVSFALLMIATRAVRGTSDLVLVTGQMAGALVLGIVMAPIGWVSPSARDFALLGLLGVVAMFAHVCVNRSLKLAPASVVVPYQYTFILWAIVFGYFVFGDVPDAMLLTGAAIIVAAGIFIFRREQVRAVQNDAGIPPPAA
ncbi:MAG TPA: DMT family transporter [Xanthobacteraceae bacterium]|jgi:drug/metabolite transporter (DMT)-like permease|nr:DMT family transporter [Xanthobacteraceae bacterium]